MNKGESHAWKYAASCAADELHRVVARLLWEVNWDHPGLPESRLILPSGAQLDWQTAEGVEKVLWELSRAINSTVAQQMFFLRLPKNDVPLHWQLFLNRGPLPWLSCGLDSDVEDVDPLTRRLADQVLLDQLARGFWSFMYQASTQEWVGDPIWIYLKQKCDRVASARDYLLKNRHPAPEQHLSAAISLHALVTSCLEQRSRRTLVARVSQADVPRFLREIDGWLADSLPSATLAGALAGLGAEPAEWFGAVRDRPGIPLGRQP